MDSVLTSTGQQEQGDPAGTGLGVPTHSRSSPCPPSRVPIVRTALLTAVPSTDCAGPGNWSSN